MRTQWMIALTAARPAAACRPTMPALKMRLKNCVLLPALIVGVSLTLAGRVAAQTYALTVLHSFSALGNGATNSDGSIPQGTLTLSGNTLYGAAGGGGKSGNGAVFRVNTDGTEFTNLYSFTAAHANASSSLTNGDGVNPNGGLLLSGTNLYGTAQSGGSSGNGTVFAINTNGTTITALHEFSAGNVNADGAGPNGGLALAGNTLYGTTVNGGEGNGVSGFGVVYGVNTDGTGFTNLNSFQGYFSDDPAFPSSGLLYSTNDPGGLGPVLYGTSQAGGDGGTAPFGGGAVFTEYIAVNGEGDPHYFTYGDDGGGLQQDGLVLSGNTLYGMSCDGGSNRFGTIYAVNTDSTGFTVLHTFTGSDGSFPQGALILSGNTLYGMANGGSSSNGTVFAINTNGTGFTNLYNFTAAHTNSSSLFTNNDGYGPLGALILVGNTLYGTTAGGGTNGNGTLFALSLPLPPPVRITTAGNKIILSWPTNANSFILQSITNLSSINWNNVTSGITIVGTNYTFTNTVNGDASFFRLKQ